MHTLAKSLPIGAMSLRSASCLSNDTSQRLKDWDRERMFVTGYLMISQARSAEDVMMRQLGVPFGSRLIGRCLNRASKGVHVSEKAINSNILQ